jgi:hypothetical protein
VALVSALALLVAVVWFRLEVTPVEAPRSSGWSNPTAATPPVRPMAPESPAASNVSGLSPGDLQFLNALSARLQQPSAPLPSDDEVDRVDRLVADHGSNTELRTFAVGLHVRRADKDLRAGSYAAVHQSLDKAKALDDREPQIYLVEAQAKAAQSDWSGVEEAARTYDEVSGEDLVISLILAESFQSQRRVPEALSVLDRPVFQSCPTATSAADINNCRAAQQMRAALAAYSEAAPTTAARSRAALLVDADKAQIQSEKFDIRFDGDDQSGVARDVLFVLDRAYVRLADVYYDRPARKIPVVLHSSRDYFTKTGAPWWSGGQYSAHDGGIQIPIRGLPSTLPREMEDVLVHELSHAFVDEMSGGRAGRDLQEGLAQYMEGKRIERELGTAELKRLASSGQRNVMSFYMLSLVVAQQLVQSRGQGTVNQLLKAMREAISEDEAFNKVFGQTGSAMKKEILETFWRRYS